MPVSFLFIVANAHCFATVLTAFFRILSPLGIRRVERQIRSKEKRKHKRKRTESGLDLPTPTNPESEGPLPPAEVSSGVLVGLRQVTEDLSRQAACSRPATSDAAETQDPSGESPPELQDSPKERPLVLVFACRSTRPSVMNAHLPLLVAAASAVHPQRPPIRLVQLSKEGEARLCTSLGLPRVGCVGLLEGTLNSRPLVEFVRSNVAEIDVPWLGGGGHGKYLPLKVNAIETFQTVAKKVAKDG